MPSSHTRRLLLRTIPASVFSLAGSASRPWASDLSLVLVAAPQTALANISLSDLRQLFLGETVHSASGTKLVPLNQTAGSPERALFDRRVLGLSPDEMARHWIDQKVRGLKGAPRSLSPPQMVARVLERFPGAVSYLRPEHSIASLRLVSIDGRDHRHARYVLGNYGAG